MARVDETRIIDRDAEVEVFESMLRCDTPRRVLVVSDKSGMGKSDVLRLLRYKCDYNFDFPVTLLDFKDFESKPQIFAVVSHLREELGGGGAEFPSFDDLNGARAFGNVHYFTERLNARVGGMASIGADGTIFNIGNIPPEHPVEWNEEAESQARTKCVEAFLVDLVTSSSQRQHVLLFDSLEKATEELERWLCLNLIRRWVLGRWESHNLIVVVAGQAVAGRLKGRLRPEYRKCIEPSASLRSWGRPQVAAFLEVHGFTSLTAGEVAAIHTLIGEGHTLAVALTFAKTLVEDRVA